MMSIVSPMSAINPSPEMKEKFLVINNMYIIQIQGDCLLAVLVNDISCDHTRYS